MRIAPLPLVLAALAAAAPLAAQDARTRAERTGFRETTRYAEVVELMEAADRASPRVHLTSMGYTMEGRSIPLAVVGTVPDASARAVRASGKTVVYLQGNIHAGEVEGKEALLVLLRELAAGRHAAWADSLVLLIAPIYNADGNERVSLTSRPHQLGPIGGQGQRPNAQGLDLNRDNTKLDSPEARSLLAMIREYDPHVLVDLHTTNGTFHAYHLTYAPPLHPNTDAGITRMLREEWLPAVTRAMKTEHGRDLFYYGNVPSPESPWAAARGAERGWYTFDHRPRFGNNYAGLRNRFGILSEAFAYLPFDQRIAVTGEFVNGVLDWARAHATAIRRATEAADRRSVAGETLALTARVRRGDRPLDILMGAVDTLRHPYTGEMMMRRRDVSRVERMPDFSTFAAAETTTAPAAWLVPAELTEVAERLAAHGVRVERLAAPARMMVEEFRIDSTRAGEAFQGHRERRVWGRYVSVEREVPAGTLRVPAAQPLGRLAFTLLEPGSDDGFLDWNLLDSPLERSPGAYPITRVAARRD
ncbi:MAG TPA: M14 family metallopeptidase [Longimicrobium sp.]